MADPLASAPPARLAAVPLGQPASGARNRALEQAVTTAVRAPSVHGVAPWRIVVCPDRLVIGVDPAGPPPGPDPVGRDLVQSAGAVLFNVRVALAARGWATQVDRLPRPDDPGVLAEVLLVRGLPDTTLAALAPAVLRRRTNRRRFTGGQVPDEVLRRLTEIAEREGVQLVPVVHESHRHLVAGLTRPAARPQDGGPAPRDVHPGAVGAPGPGPRPDADATMVLLATRSDDPRAWLRAGEAAQHVLLELIRLGWVAGPVPQAVEVPITRMRLRAALTWDAHPQLLLRIGHAAPAVPTLHRRPADAGLDDRRSSWAPAAGEPSAPTG